MAGKALIKLRPKPQKPRRKKLKLNYAIYEDMSLDQILDYFDVTDPSAIKITFDHNWDNTDVYAVYEREQTDEEHEEDLKRYRGRKKKYDEWYSENETTIKMEIQRRKDEAARKEREANERARKRLKKELAKLEKEVG